MAPIRNLRSRTVVLPAANIDTDQIIPARFLTTTTRHGLGQHLFADWRYDAKGAPQSDFILNSAAVRDCHILVAGRNFGCGSSREHAPWALLDYGFRAVISTQIADIFRSNALKNGLVPVVVDAATASWLIEHPGVEVSIDLPTATLTLPAGTVVSFPLETFARYCLVNGIDELGFLIEREAKITAFERRRRSA
jgi:3-isopropylmalate/(R)-2-methylmalate dehydratase small subunit